MFGIDKLSMTTIDNRYYHMTRTALRAFSLKNH